MIRPRSNPKPIAASVTNMPDFSAGQCSRETTEIVRSILPSDSEYRKLLRRGRAMDVSGRILLTRIFGGKIRKPRRRSGK